MKIGMCTAIENAELCIKAGADFIEVNNNKISVMSDEEFEKALELSRKYPGKFTTCNGLIPKDVRLTGENVDYDFVTEFCEKSFERLSRLGVKTLVFGSGGAKQVPEGFSFETAMEQLVKCVRIFADVAAKYGQTVVIEPLRYQECNIINLVSESQKLAELSERDNVKAHMDFYHFMQNGETLTELKKYAAVLGHVHIASPVWRKIPTFDDGANYQAFIDIIRDGNPEQTVSYEGKSELDFDKLCTMFAFLKSL